MLVFFVVIGWQALLKLCFQAFIVPSSADEAGPVLCTRLGRGGMLNVYGVKFSEIFVPDLSSCSPLLVEVMLKLL